MAAVAFAVVLTAALAAGRRWRQSPYTTGPGASLPRSIDETRSDLVGSNEQNDNIESVARAIEKKYGVEVAWKNQKYPVKTYHGPIGGANASTTALDRYSTILAHEFLLYPPDFIRRSRLKQIVLCRGLSFDGQDRTAVPDFEHDTLYLDVVRGEHSRIYQRNVIHHDFFHIIDYRDDGELGSDKPWQSLNPEAFRYGNGGERMQDDPLSGLSSDRPGFLTRYATSAVGEDKAELFSHLMTEYAVVAQRAAEDRIIREKVSLLKARLAKYCPALDDAFWNQVSRR
jgi:hypothetical protein